MATRTKRTVKSPAKAPAAAKAAKATPAPPKASKTGTKSGKPRGRSRAEGTALVIVESPTKAKTIGKYLGAGYDVRATVGHLRDLPTRELGVDVENGFEPKYVTIKGKTKTLSELKKAAKTASTIFLATDPDREGEAIAWHVADQLNSKAPTHRILFHEITKDAIREALADPGQIDDRKVNAQQARRILDRLVGYKASPILWRSIKTGLSAGRVQTVALRLIVERERDIRAFVPQEYWSIEALCAKGGRPSRRRSPRSAATSRSCTRRRMPNASSTPCAPGPSRSPRSRSASGGRIRPRPSPPARCSRRPPRSWAFPPGAPCGRPRTCTRARMWVRMARSASSRTCAPTRSACPTPLSPRCATSSAGSTPRDISPRRRTCTARRRTPGCRTPTRRSARPTCPGDPSRSSSTSSPTSSACISSSGSASSHPR